MLKEGCEISWCYYFDGRRPIPANPDRWGRICRTISRGGSAEVFEVDSDGLRFALKYFHEDKPLSRVHLLLEEWNLGLLLRSLPSRGFFPRLKGFSGAHDFFVLEFVDGLTIEECISRKPAGHAAELVFAFLLEGFFICETLTRVDLVHGDVSGRNVLVTNSGRIVLVDWETARRSGSHRDKGKRVGTGLFGDPEFFEHGVVNPYMDLYGFAVCAIGLLLGEHFGKLLSVQTWRRAMRSVRTPVEELEDGTWGRLMDRLFDTENRRSYRSSVLVRAYLIGLARAADESPRLRQVLRQRETIQEWIRQGGPEVELARRWFGV